MICSVCQKYTSDYDSRGRPKKVCSSSCGLIRGRPKYVPIIVPCNFCGKQVRKSPATIKHSKSGKLFCSQTCQVRYFNQRHKRISLFCDYCSKKLSRSKSGIENHNFCDRKCLGLWKRQFTGEKAFNWKGGYNKTERERIRSRKFWKDLRITILGQYDFRCGDCGEFGRTLHIHHIKPYRLGGKDEIDNLIPLCAKCHSKQTVRDWEEEHQQRWAMSGAHTHRLKEGD